MPLHLTIILALTDLFMSPWLLQMFRKPVRSAKQGDRLGLCVTNLDAAKIERGIAAAPGSVPLLQDVLCMVRKVRFFKGICKSNFMYHVSIGHTTIVAQATFFGAKELGERMAIMDDGGKVSGKNEAKKGTMGARALISGSSFPSIPYDENEEFLCVPHGNFRWLYLYTFSTDSLHSTSLPSTSTIILISTPRTYPLLTGYKKCSGAKKMMMRR